VTHKFNTQRKFGEAQCYVHAVIDGRHCLFTEDQVRVAQERARTQQEDVPKPVRAWWRFWK